MGLFVNVEDAEGESLWPVFEISVIQGRFPEAGGAVCLPFIGEGDDVRFNRAQAAVLASELAALDALGLGDGERAELGRVRTAIAKLGGKPGSAIAFYGDF